MADLKSILQSLKDLNPTDLGNLISALSNIKSTKLQQTQDPSNQVEEDLPAMSIPQELMMPFLELIFISFIKEVAKNYINDYSYSEPDQLTNNLSVNVASFYDATELKDGQYPKIRVKCQGLNLSVAGLANTGYNPLTILGPNQSSDNKTAWLNFTMTIDVISSNDSEVDILSTMYALHLMQAMEVLRKIAYLYKIDFPSVSGAQQIRQYEDLFMSRIQFGCIKQVDWEDIVTEKTYNNIILAMQVECKNNPGHAVLEQIILAGINDPKVIQVVTEREKRNL